MTLDDLQMSPREQEQLDELARVAWSFGLTHLPYEALRKLQMLLDYMLTDQHQTLTRCQIRADQVGYHAQGLIR